MGSAYTEVLYDQSGESLGENNRTTWTQSYVNFAGRHLAIYQNNATYFPHVNALGSTTSVTDYTGAVVEDKLFYPWGQDWQAVGTLYEERFAKLQHRDSETSLDPTPNRMFSSQEGRWLSPDPLFGIVSDPQSLNRYAYALNNPATLTDPTGLIAPGPCIDPNAPGCGNPFIDEFFLSALLAGAALPVNPDLLEIHLEIHGDRGDRKSDRVQAAIDKALGLAKKLLADPCCAKFLESVLTNLGLKPDLDHFKKTLGELNIVQAPPPGPNAPWWQTQTTAYVPGIGQTSTVDVVKPFATDLAPTLLHEDFHTIFYGFGDVALAEAAGKFNPGNLTGDALQQAASKFASAEFEKNCDPSKLK